MRFAAFTWRRPVKVDNGQTGLKLAVRSAAIEAARPENVVETHAGLGFLRSRMYSGFGGAVCEKDRAKAERLAAKFRNLTVVYGDSLAYLKVPDFGFVASLVDIDPYGDPWPHVRACMSCKALPGRFVLAVTDGLVQSCRLSTTLKASSLRPVAAAFGAHDLFRRYGDVVRFLLGHWGQQFGCRTELLALKWSPSVVCFAAAVERVADAEPVRVSPRGVDLRYKTAGWQAMRQAVIVRAGGKCESCGKPSPKDMNIDHVRPLNAGGPHGIENLRALCRSCHSAATRNAQDAGILPGGQH
jgi:hypothetical protein